MCRSAGKSRKAGISTEEMKADKIFADLRNDFTNPRFSEMMTGISDSRVFSRFSEKPYGFVKSNMTGYNHHIIPPILRGCGSNNQI